MANAQLLDNSAEILRTQAPGPREAPVREDALCFVCLRWTWEGPDCHQPWCPDRPDARRDSSREGR
jgi:hypothetical protein